MPQASDELRAKMTRYFGDGISDNGPLRYLLECGYKEKAGVWYRPSIDHVISEKESDCLEFLCDEWDYDFDPTTSGKEGSAK